MLTNALIKKIEDYVQAKPRSIQEVSNHVGKNWRTVDRYVQQIKEEFGTIETRTFREGTRGALKIVYWASPDKVSCSVFQEKLEADIFSARKKEDFSAFDIYQYVPEAKKKSIVERKIHEETTNLRELKYLLKNTQKELRIFSGNLSFINMKTDNIDLFSPIEELVKKGVKVKIVCKVDITGKQNIERILSLNYKYGKELVQIKHREHPLRALIFDDKVFRIKEIKEPTGKIRELDKKIFIFYTIKDKEWTEWLAGIFNKMFNSSIGVEKRLEEINKIFR